MKIDNAKIRVMFNVYNSSINFINGATPDTTVEYSNDKSHTLTELNNTIKTTPSISFSVGAEDFKSFSANLSIANMEPEYKTLLSKNYNDFSKDGSKTITATVEVFYEDGYVLAFQGVVLEGVPNEMINESIMNFKLLPHISLENKNILINVPLHENGQTNTRKDIKQFVANALNLSLISDCSYDNEFIKNDIYEYTSNISVWLKNFFKNEFVFITYKELIFFDEKSTSKHNFLPNKQLSIDEYTGMSSVVKTGFNTFTVEMFYNPAIQFGVKLIVSPKSKKYKNITHGTIEGVVIGYNSTIRSSVTTTNGGKTTCNIIVNSIL